MQRLEVYLPSKCCGNASNGHHVEVTVNVFSTALSFLLFFGSPLLLLLSRTMMMAILSGEPDDGQSAFRIGIGNDLFRVEHGLQRGQPDQQAQQDAMTSATRPPPPLRDVRTWGRACKLAA